MTQKTLTGQEIQDNLKTYVGLVVKPEDTFTEAHFAIAAKHTTGQNVAMAGSIYPKGSEEEINVAFNTKADESIVEATNATISALRAGISGSEEEL